MQLIIEIAGPDVRAEGCKVFRRQETAVGHFAISFHVLERSHPHDNRRNRGRRQAEAEGGFR